jgi:tetratricopeptide (TPR) repeat protein
MKKAFLCLATVMISLGVVRANLEERDRAMALSKSGDHKAAIEVFVNLAAGTNETRKSENLLQAALCAQRMGDNSKAMELAGQIPSEPYATFCKMEILRSSGGREELVAMAGKIDFTTWPEKLIYPALMSRGEAYLGVGKTGEAEADFLEAARHTLSPQQKARTVLYQAEVLAAEGKSPDEVLAVYDRIVEMAPKGGGILQRAHLAKARLFAAKGQKEPAIAEIVAVENSGSKDAYWVAATNLTYGQVFEALGKTSEAEAHYQKVVDLASPPKEILDEAKTRLRTLRAAGEKSQKP